MAPWSHGPGVRGRHPHLWPWRHARGRPRPVASASMRPTEAELLRWSEALAGIARTGLGFTQSLYERERFEEVLHVAADMRVVAGLAPDGDDIDTVVADWLDS